MEAFFIRTRENYPNMRRVLYLFGELDDADIDRLIAMGERRSFASGAVLIEEGRPVADIFVLLQGCLAVKTGAGGETEIQHRYPGEVMGEISFLDSRPPSASVVAVEESTVLAVPRSGLQLQLERDPPFAARFYRALGLFLASRLRSLTARFGYGELPPDSEPEHPDELDPALLETTAVAANRFEHMRRRLLS